MSPWRTVALGDVAESVDYGVTASAKEQPPGPKFLRITDIQNGIVQWAKVPWCDCGAQAAADARLRAGDIVFARTGATTGKSFLIRECPADAVFASYLIRVRLPTTVEPRFVSHYLQTQEYWAQITKGARGVAQPGVNATTLKSLTVPLPPLPEQRRIAAILDKADELRAKQRAALEQLKGLTESMFLEMFGDPVTNRNRWPVVSLGSLVVHGPQNGLYKPSSDYGSGTRILRIDAFYDGMVTNVSSLKRVRISDNEQALFGLAAGDIVVNRVNSMEYLGKSALVPDLAEPVVFESNMMRLRVDPTTTDAQYVVQALQTASVKQQIARRAKHAINQASVNQQDVCGLQLSLPPLQLQREYARRQEVQQVAVTKGEAALAGYDELFASLQHQAFSGAL